MAEGFIHQLYAKAATIWGIHSRNTALQHSDYCRAKFMAEISIYDSSMLVWIDETVINITVEGSTVIQ